MSKKKWASETTKNAPKNKKEVFAVFLTLLIGFIIFMGGLWFIASVAYNNKHEAIDRNPAYTMCTITRKYPYKGKSVDIECFINEKKHCYREAVSPEYYRTLKIGQEVAVKYCKDDPSLATIVEP